MPTSARWLPVIASLLLVAACASGGADACAEASVTVEATVTADALEPNALSVCKGQDVTLALQSETDGEFHLHGYDEQVPETSLTAGQTTTITFTADAAGQFIIELHPAAGEDEVEIGVLTVNEP